MFAVLSPAKKLAAVTRALPKPTLPALASRTQDLVPVVKGLAAADLKRLMGISDKLAALNVERFASLKSPAALGDGTPAALTFAGDTYQGLDASTWSDEDFAWAKTRVGILSGLYGLLSPADEIQPYRLEMGTKLANIKGKDLYAFWGQDIANAINERVADHEDATVVVCASHEYFRAVDHQALAYKTVTPVFRERWDGKCQPISFFAKRARGAMASEMVRRRWTKVEQLKTFAWQGYAFDPDNSDDQQFVFVRDKPAPATSKKAR